MRFQGTRPVSKTLYAYHAVHNIFFFFLRFIGSRYFLAIVHIISSIRIYFLQFSGARRIYFVDVLCTFPPSSEKWFVFYSNLTQPWPSVAFKKSFDHNISAYYLCKLLSWTTRILWLPYTAFNTLCSRINILIFY